MSIPPDTPRTPPARPASGPAWSDAGYAAWVRAAMEEAQLVWSGASSGVTSSTRGAGDVPIGALVLDRTGAVIGRGHNVREEAHDPTGHAEVVALRQAGEALGTWRLAGCTLVVTLEPCTMCAGAALLARVERIVFGAWDDKAGACGSVWDLPRDRRALHQAEVVGGVLAQENAALLRDFFQPHRLR